MDMGAQSQCPSEGKHLDLSHLFSTDPRTKVSRSINTLFSYAADTAMSTESETPSHVTL